MRLVDKPDITVAPDPFDRFSHLSLSQRADAVAREAHHHETLTRARVEILEGRVNDISQRNLWGRLKWLWTGE